MNENEDFKAHYRWHSFVLIAQFTNVDNLNRLSVSIFCLVQRLQHALFNHIPPTESKSEPFSHAQIEKYPLSVSSSLIGIKTLFFPKCSEMKSEILIERGISRAINISLPFIRRYEGASERVRQMCAEFPST